MTHNLTDRSLLPLRGWLPRHLVLALLALALVACSSDSKSSGGGDDNGGGTPDPDPADEFVYGEWELGTPGTPVEGTATDGPWSDWAPTSGTDDTIVQTRMRTITTPTTAERTDTRTCEVQVNGDEDEPALDCDNEITERTVEVDDTDETVQTETRTIDNATDTAAWVDTGTATFSGGDAQEEGDDEVVSTLAFSSGGVTLDATITPTFNKANATRMQTRVCTRVVMGLEDDGMPTCTDSDNMTVPIGNSFTFTETATQVIEDTANAVDYDYSNMLNPLSYTSSDVVANGFRDASITGGYDVVNSANASKRFLITNVGTGTKGIVVDGEDNRTFCIDANGDGACTVLGGDTIAPKTLLLLFYKTGNSGVYSLDEVALKTAHGAGWYGHGGYAEGYNFGGAVIYDGITAMDSMAIVAPGLSVNVPDTRNGANPTFKDAMGLRVQIRRDNTSANDQDTLVISSHCGCSATDDRSINIVRPTASASDRSAAEIVEYVGSATGYSALVWQKYPELNPDQVEDIIIATRDSAKRIQILRALSPVGHLE